MPFPVLSRYEKQTLSARVASPRESMYRSATSAVDDVFLDLHGIGARARWKEALAKANEPAKPSSSPHSLTSNECYVEPGSTLPGVGS